MIMKTSTIVSGIAGGIFLWLAGFIFYGMMDGTAAYESEGMRAMMKGENMDMLMLLLGHLIIGIFAAMIFNKWTRGAYSWRMGLEFGLILGVIPAVGMNMIWYSVSSGMSGMGHVVDGIFNLIAYAITGVVISLVMGMMDK